MDQVAQLKEKVSKLEARAQELEKLVHSALDMNEQLQKTVREQAQEIKRLHQVIQEQAQINEQLSEVNRRQAAIIEKQQRRIDYLEKQLYGTKSERMHPPEEELRNRQDKLSAKERAERQRQRDKDAQEKKRRNREKNRDLLDTETHRIAVPASQCICPECGNTELDLVSEGRTTEIIEMKLKKVVRQIYIQEVRSCKCGSYITTAPSPEKVVEGGKYGPGLYANVVTGKCLDSLPLNRQCNILERHGVHIAPSVVGSMFHQAADQLKPIWDALQQELLQRSIIQADETGINSQTDKQGNRKKHTLHQAYMWCFLSGHTESEPTILYYRYSIGRTSAETPEKVLGDYKGKLLADGYGGYTPITGVDKAQRAGCIAHMRRKFFEAQDAYPPAATVLEKIIELYDVEREAQEMNISGTEKHLELRKEKSGPIMDAIEVWITEHETLANPQNPIHVAITYAMNQWVALNLFLDDAKLPLDNNRSERALRLIALGRKNYLFVGNHEAGTNLAILQSLTATAVANGVNPELYIKDVLLQVNTHPMKELKQLLPWNWAKIHQKTN